MLTIETLPEVKIFEDLDHLRYPRNSLSRVEGTAPFQTAALDSIRTKFEDLALNRPPHRSSAKPPLI
jgi:hypothetical protein